MPKNLLARFHPKGGGRDKYTEHPENAPILSVSPKNVVNFSQDFKIYNQNKKNVQLPNFSRPPAIGKYSNDGKGRDTFIYENNGGFEKPDNYNPHNFFKRLRGNNQEIPPKKKFLNNELESRIKRGRIAVQEPNNKVIDIKLMVDRLNQPQKKQDIKETRYDAKIKKDYITRRNIMFGGSFDTQIENKTSRKNSNDKDRTNNSQNRYMLNKSLQVNGRSGTGCEKRRSRSVLNDKSRSKRINLEKSYEYSKPQDLTRDERDGSNINETKFNGMFKKELKTLYSPFKKKSKNVPISNFVFG